MLNAIATGDSVIVDVHDQAKVFGLVLKKGKNKTDGWNLVIPPGTDPVFVIMIAAILTSSWLFKLMKLVIVACLVPFVPELYVSVGFSKHCAQNNTPLHKE